MYKLSKLNNGITLIIVPVAGTKATTVLAMFPVGSRYETKKIFGAAHFVEHMMFKGTEKRPAAMDISRALESVGAEYNAFTNKDYTGYYVRIDAAKQEVAFDVLSDVIYHSKLEKAEMDKERGAIVEELRMYRDNPTFAVDLLFDQTMFGDHPLGWDIGGSEKTVRSISRQELWKYYQKHYSPKNMVLVVAGKIDQRLKRLIKYFADKIAPAKAKGPAFYKNSFLPLRWPNRPLPLAQRVGVEKRKADQAHLILGFPGINNNHPDRFAASVLITILGVGMSSRLFLEVREKRGLAYMVHAGSASYRDVGAVYVQAGLDPARLEEALAVIKAELARTIVEPVTERELNDAKNQIIGNLALSLENSKTQAEWYGRQFLFNTKIETPEEVVRKLRQVKIKDVQKVARNFFKPELMRVAIIGALEKEIVMKYLK